MNPATIIGLGHQSGTGKDTLARAIVDGAGFNDTLHLSFAGELKYDCFRLYQTFGVKPAGFYDTNREERKKVIPRLGMTIVQLWIAYGNAMRSIYADYWIDRLKRTIDQHTYYAKMIVISDVRFPNEIEAIRSWGGEVWKVTRPDQPLHGSDTEIHADFMWDRYIPNDFPTVDALMSFGECFGSTLVMRGASLESAFLAAWRPYSEALENLT